MGILPTDTLTAIVCDVEDRAAVARLYAIKEVANPLTKPLSLLCRGLDDVAKYTQGLPGGGGPGAPNLFRIANAVLKTDVAVLKTDVAGLKTDVKELRTDVAGLKTTVDQILAFLVNGGASPVVR